LIRGALTEMLAMEAPRADLQVSDGWVAALADVRSAACEPARALVLSPGAEALLSSSAHSRCTAVFDGVLYNREDLANQLTTPGPKPETNVDLVRLAYERWGEDLLQHVKGIFALIVWDGAREVLLAARDPLGHYPLFWAKANGRTLCSTDVRALVGTPGVSRALNRVALADHLCHRWSQPEETYFAAVNRVPPGHAVRLHHHERRLWRYWDPTPPGEPVRWITEPDLEGFEQRFDDAVNRCLTLGRTGIFLSGGFDSVSIAAVAADNARRLGLPAPLALSLGFPDPECNEEPVQRGVAAQLSLPQVMMPFQDAVGSRGLLASAVAMAGTWPVPMLNFWNPAYSELASRGVQRGCQAILTGNGGDEWLGVTPYLAADLIRALDVSGLAQYVATLKRSYSASRFALWRGALWTFGTRPLLSAALGRIAPEAWRARRVRRLVASTPTFVAPDPEVRRSIDARAGRNLADPNPPAGFYLQDGRTALNHPLMAIDQEETFEMGQRLGVRFLHPYWDADLVDMLHRIPPRLLNRGGRLKGLVRYTVANRFPDLGFERHKKVAATNFFRRIIREEGPAVWRAMGRPHGLEALGVVDGREVHNTVSALLGGLDPSQFFRVWDVLALESWVRQS